MIVDSITKSQSIFWMFKDSLVLILNKEAFVAKEFMDDGVRYSHLFKILIKTLSDVWLSDGDGLEVLRASEAVENEGEAKHERKNIDLL